MRLTKLKLAGFKSFVDLTTVPFPTQLTAVLGPNGCGKSNVIDAVRWVMGESSAKELRGENMSDVIFNGCATRKPVGVASVELVFDNSDASIGGEYAMYAELALKRQVGRDGSSKYYLNGEPCRRKDITGIFLGTGLGSRSYSVIGQGTISKLVEAKPEEFRMHLEEAAGISKYKERRRETETRMRHTRENLERLHDIHGELSKQIERLERQAQAAEKYQELRQEERLFKAQLLALRWQTLNLQHQQQEKIIQEQAIQLESYIAEQRSYDNDIETERQNHIEHTDQFNDVQKQYYQIGSQIARLEQAISDQHERQHQLQSELEEAALQLREAQSHLELDHTHLEETQIALQAANPQHFAAKEAFDAAVTEQQEAEDQKAVWQQSWDEFNLQAHESSKTAQVEQTRIQGLENQLSAIQHQCQQLQDEAAGFDVSGLEAHLAEYLEQEALCAAQIEEVETQLAEQQQRIATARDALQQYQSQQNDQQNRLQQVRGRLTSLEVLQQAALGKDKGGIQSWLSANDLGEAPRLAETMTVTVGYESLVETVLGNYLQAVCVDGVANWTQLAASITNGEVILLDNQHRTPQTNSAVSSLTLAQVVKTDVASVQSTLAAVYVADDIHAAEQQLANLPLDASVITREGVWLGHGWIRVKRESGNAQVGILAREQEIKQLSAEIDNLLAELEQVQELIAENKADLHTSERARDDLAHQLADQQKMRAGWHTKQVVAENNLQRMHERHQAIEIKLAEQHAAADLLGSDLEVARSSWNQAMAAMDLDADRRMQLIAERDLYTQQLDSARVILRDKQAEVHALAMTMQAKQTEKNALEQSIQRANERIKQLTLRHENLQNALNTAVDPNGDLQSELEDQLTIHANAEEQLQTARMALETAEDRLHQLEDKRSAADQNARAIQSTLEQLRMNGQAVTVRCATLEESITETEFQLEELLQGLTDEANETAWEDELGKIAARIQRLGAINLAAIEEFKTESERKVYLDSQLEDLSEALNTLEEAIRKIDKETRQRFKDTFDTVNQHFKELFPRLFGGGQAYLELTGEDLLDTGVSIIARPPGKRNSSIHLLSGGEKAMTAVALVFSIFQLNPSPFCMLDEVDAPLDDANVTRFCNMVREMSQKTQFIFITHNKLAMELADNLVGVTMQEPGVSRLVAVDIEEAMALAEA